MAKSSIKTELLFACLILAMTSMASAEDPVPAHETFELSSEAVGELRRLNVWKPPGYDATGAAYPVLYMPDGGIQEDFPHIANTVAELVAQQKISPVLLVGIENTERRRDLTGPSSVEADAQIAPITDGASRFRQFIRDELFPEIESRYHVSDRRAIVGESAAGLFVIETFFLEPTMFERSIAMDPAIYWNDAELVRRAPERLRTMDAEGRHLWMATASTEEIAPHVQALAEILRTDAPDALEWKFVDRPQEQHHTIFRATKEEAFTSTLW